MELRNCTFFFSQLPQVSAWGPCFHGVDLFPPGWNGGFHLWRYSGGLSVVCFDRWFLPDSSALGAGLPGLLGACSWSCCLRHVQVVAATAAPPVLHTLRQPWFSSKTMASWVSTVASASDSERVFTFGLFSLLGIQLSLVAFYPSG